MTRRLATARDLCLWNHADPDSNPLRPSTLRVWVLRGRLKTYGRRNGWNLYDVAEVLRLVRERDTATQQRARR